MPGKGPPREHGERFGRDLLLYGAVRRSGTPHYPHCMKVGNSGCWEQKKTPVELTIGAS